jgi:cytochrome P450
MAGVGRVGQRTAVNTMFTTDPPEHSRIRGVMQKAFTPRTVADLEPRVRELVDGIVDRLEPGQVFDVVNDLSVVMSITVIAELLGVPADDRGLFLEWSDALVAGNSPGCSEAEAHDADKAADLLCEYFEQRIAERRRRPTSSDLIGRLITANTDGTLNEDELLASCVNLLFAGGETTTKLVGNSMLCLAQHPDQRQRLIDDPGIMPAALEELLRFAGPVQAWLRVATEDAEVGGTTVGAGELVFLMAGCANRDPDNFDDPEKLDLTRSPNNHFGFGHGIHHCLGAALARLESRIAISRLLAKAPEYEVARPGEPLQYSNSFFLRGLTAFDIVVSG